MDFVYICRPGENEELRYSIRSIIKNMDAKNIWVVGGKPDWYEGNFIPVTDTGNKFQNIQQCLSVICDIHEISEDFIFMNDDFFVLNNKKDIETYYDGSLDEKILKYIDLFRNNQYSRILTFTNNKLKKLGINEPKNYDVHYPMIMNRHKLKQIVNITLAPRSFYGNYFNVGGSKVSDVKVYKKNFQLDFSNSFISTEDNSFILVLDKLKEMFPDKSICEK